MKPPRRGTDQPCFAILAALLEGLPVGLAVRGGPRPVELQAKGYERKTFSLKEPPIFGPAEEEWREIIGFLIFWHNGEPEVVRFPDHTMRSVPVGESLPWGVKTLPSKA